jgi:2-oxoglutarate ferredoxin oxidoreductase subunit alpha
MRGGPSTGQPTKSSQQDVMQAKYGSHGDYEIIALCPSSVQEAYELTIKAFNLAEQYRVPVILLPDEIVGHTREKLLIPASIPITERSLPSKAPDQYKPYEPLPSGLLDGMPVFGKGYKVLVDGQLHDEYGIRAGHDAEISGKLMERLCKKITDHTDELVDVESFFIEDADTVVIAYGSVARSAFAAVKQAREQGIKVGILKLKMLWPFPDDVIREAIRKAKQVIVPEMNIGKISREIERIDREGKKIVSLPKLGGNLHTPDEIMDAIRRK